MDPREWSTEAKIAAGVGAAAVVGAGAYYYVSTREAAAPAKETKPAATPAAATVTPAAPAAAATPAAAVTSAAPAAAAASEAVPRHGVPGTKAERSFIAVKPDGTQRGLVGEIIRRFEAKGFKLVALKMVTPTPEFAAQHYDDLKLKPFFPGLVKFFSSGPVVAMVWEGLNVIKSGRVLLGATNPADSNPGTIRGDFSVHVGRNICHGSDSAEGTYGAEHEINLWWKPEEIINWTSSQQAWIYESK